MFVVIGWMLAGMLVGRVLRHWRLRWTSGVVTLLIWLLLFLLGAEAGANPAVINGLHTLGLEALLLAVAGVGGSAVAAWALWCLLTRGPGKEDGA